jgi:cytochrome c oxidase subunit 4
MSPRLRDLSRGWALLLGLLAIEFGASFALQESARPLVLIPAVLMAGIVATIFMELGRGPEASRLFAVAGLLWLAILLGLGSLDPMTRIVYHLQTSNPTSVSHDSPEPGSERPSPR